MTQAQLDLAHKTIGDLGHCVRAMEQYGNAKIASAMRNAASLLQAMVDENEQMQLPLQHLRAHQAAHGEGDESDG